MASFRSVLVVCITSLVVFFFTMDFIKEHFRYEFLVKGDVCIAFDHKELSIKVVGPTGCATVPINKTEEQKMREQIEAEVNKKIQTSLNQLVPSATSVAPQPPQPAIMAAG